MLCALSNRSINERSDVSYGFTKTETCWTQTSRGRVDCRAYRRHSAVGTSAVRGSAFGTASSSPLTICPPSRYSWAVSARDSGHFDVMMCLSTLVCVLRPTRCDYELRWTQHDNIIVWISSYCCFCEKIKLRRHVQQAPSNMWLSQFSESQSWLITILLKYLFFAVSRIERGLR